MARLMARGTTLGHGATSSLPTVTLANHTAIITGAHPGHHGILNNAWWDRDRRAQVITNSPTTWATSMETLAPGIESMHDAVHRAYPDSFTASVNEFCDVGADFSTFGVMRAGGSIDRPPPIDELPHTTEMFVRPVKEYRSGTISGTTRVAGVAEGVTARGLATERGRIDSSTRLAEHLEGGSEIGRVVQVVARLQISGVTTLRQGVQAVVGVEVVDGDGLGRSCRDRRAPHPVPRRSMRAVIEVAGCGVRRRRDRRGRERVEACDLAEEPEPQHDERER